MRTEISKIKNKIKLILTRKLQFKDCCQALSLIIVALKIEKLRINIMLLKITTK
jgi:hypothetical protein